MAIQISNDNGWRWSIKYYVKMPSEEKKKLPLKNEQNDKIATTIESAKANNGLGDGNKNATIIAIEQQNVQKADNEKDRKKQQQQQQQRK